MLGDLQHASASITTVRGAVSSTWRRLADESANVHFLFTCAPTPGYLNLVAFQAQTADVLGGAMAEERRV